jgi:hypothetical protein
MMVTVGKMTTTRVRRRTSWLIRYSPLVVRIRHWWGAEKAKTVSSSGTLVSSQAANLEAIFPSSSMAFSRKVLADERFGALKMARISAATSESMVRRGT